MLPGEQPPLTERTRDNLLQQLGSGMLSQEFVLPDPDHGGRIIYKDIADRFWLITVEEARVGVSYQGPG